VGFFVNTLALRTEVNGDASFEELLRHVRTTILEAYDHQEAPFEKVVEAVVKERDLSRAPLFQVMFAFQDEVRIDELSLSGLQLQKQEVVLNTAKFDITFVVNETSKGYQLNVEYNS